MTAKRISFFRCLFPPFPSFGNRGAAVSIFSRDEYFSKQWGGDLLGNRPRQRGGEAEQKHKTGSTSAE